MWWPKTNDAAQSAIPMPSTVEASIRNVFHCFLKSSRLIIVPRCTMMKPTTTPARASSDELASRSSEVADISNLGGPFAGSTTAALFLQQLVGDTPWAHVDIAGTMQVDADEAWRSKGATGFGARLLAEVARGYTAGG